MGLRFWIHGFWIAGLLIQPVLVAILLLKKVWIKFPLFTAFAVYSLLGDTIAYLFVGTRLYVAVYLIYEAMSVVLVLLVVYEIFSTLFSSHHALRRLASISFCAVCLVLALVGATVILAHSPIGEKGVVAAVLVVEEASRILELGLIMFLFLFSGVFGLHWRQNVFGIVLGLGISAAVKLAAVTIPRSSYTVVGMLNMSVMLAYDLSLLIWIGYLLAPERIPVDSEMPKRAQLEQWNQAIMELIHQ